MDYICLAAGKGTRFGQLGSYLQKCMYPIGLRPFIELSINNLRQSATLHVETDRLILVVGHHKEQLEHYFGNSYDGLSIHYVEQTEALGTGHALHLVYETHKPSNSSIIWLADAYVPRARFEALAEHPEINVQTLAPGHEDESDNLRIGFSNGFVTKAWGGDSDWYDIGLWKFSSEVMASMTTLKTGKEYRALPNLQHQLEQGARIGYIQVEEWIHLGGVLPTPEQNVLQVTERVLELEREAGYSA